MRRVLDHDRSFPDWLTLTSAWWESIEDSADVRARIGASLRRLRVARGLSLEGLARDLDIPAMRLHRLESAAERPDIGLLLKAAAIFKVPASRFLAAPGEHPGIDGPPETEAAPFDWRSFVRNLINVRRGWPNAGGPARRAPSGDSPVRRHPRLVSRWSD
jgi:transcriptional regulator with XRE-family HTH domain